MTTAGKRKRQNANSGATAFAFREKSGSASFFPIPSELGCFMATFSSTSIKLSSVWICDSANCPHICYNCSAFLTFHALTREPSITTFGGTMSAEGEKDIHLTCKSLDGKPEVWILNKVQYMP